MIYADYGCQGRPKIVPDDFIEQRFEPKLPDQPNKKAKKNGGKTASQ